MIQPTGTENRE